MSTPPVPSLRWRPLSALLRLWRRQAGQPRQAAASRSVVRYRMDLQHFLSRRGLLRLTANGSQSHTEACPGRRQVPCLAVIAGRTPACMQALIPSLSQTVTCMDVLQAHRSKQPGASSSCGARKQGRAPRRGSRIEFRCTANRMKRTAGRKEYIEPQSWQTDAFPLDHQSHPKPNRPGQASADQGRPLRSSHAPDSWTDRRHHTPPAHGSTRPPRSCTPAALAASAAASAPTPVAAAQARASARPRSTSSSSMPCSAGSNAHASISRSV